MQLLTGRRGTLVLAGWILFLMLCCKAVLGQDSSSTVERPLFAQASVLYDFPQSHGMTLGVEVPLHSINKIITSKKGKTSTIERDIIGGINAGFYRYPYDYTGVLLLPFVGRRHYHSPNFFTESSLGVGVLRTFYDGKVYKVDGSGNVSEANLFGRFYATTNLSFGFNWLLHNPNIALQLKPSLWFQFPYNSFIKPHASLEAGVKYEIGRRTVSLKTIHKNRR
jgi:hypothetical protein